MQDTLDRGRFRAVLAATGSAIVGAGRALTDAIVPAVCVACRTPIATHDELCGACWRQVAFIRPPVCDRLGLPLPFSTGDVAISAAAAANPPVYARARAVAAFDGIIRDLIHGFKYADRHDARRLFGRWLAQAGAELLATADMLVPVPLARWRLLRRQFNQAAILAQELSRSTGIPFDPHILRRTRATASQVGLSHEERRRNVRGAFDVASRRANALSGRRIVLIDDVITTGATVEACARALLAAGAGQVDVLALALVTNPGQASP
jgi:ComF family protein